MPEVELSPEMIIEAILEIDGRIDDLRLARTSLRRKLDETWKFRLEEIEEARRVR